MAAADITSTARAQATMCAALVDQWVRDGVSFGVIAPGSRSTPMAMAIADRREISIEIFHDERSAAFAALGIGVATGMPAILLCTSGSAATHFHGAVVEADLSDVPMLVVTADRPPELRDVGAAQTIDQTRLFGPAVRWFHDPGVAAAEASGTWRSLARQAFELASGRRGWGSGGPVHLNLPFREPLMAPSDSLPPAHLGPPMSDGAVVRVGTLAMQLEQERGVIVAGRGVDDPDAVIALAAATGWPVLGDPRSGCRGHENVVSSFDAMLRHRDFASSHRPDVVVHLGEPPASKVLAQWLGEAGGIQVRVSTATRVIDPAHTITHRIIAPVGAVCRRLAAELSGASGSAWSTRWMSASGQVNDAIARTMASSTSLDEPSVARCVSLFDGWAMVASSMPIRDLEWFGSPDQRARVISNRGANGIDGTVASAIGVGAATGEPVVVLLGDIALLHDQSSLTALAGRNVDVRIVVVDNDGGGIFSFLPQASSMDADRFERLFGTPHGTDLCALAAAHGLSTANVTSTAELDSWLTRPGPSLARVPSSRPANVAVHQRINDAAVSSLSSS